MFAELQCYPLWSIIKISSNQKYIKKPWNFVSVVVPERDHIINHKKDGHNFPLLPVQQDGHSPAFEYYFLSLYMRRWLDTAIPKLSSTNHRHHWNLPQSYQMNNFLWKIVVFETKSCPNGFINWNILYLHLLYVKKKIGTKPIKLEIRIHTKYNILLCQSKLLEIRI